MRIEFDQASSRLTFNDTHTTGASIQAGIAWARYRLNDGTARIAQLLGPGASIHEQVVTDVNGICTEWVCRCLPNPDGIEFSCHIKSYEKQPFILLMISIHNLGRVPIHLDEMCLYQADPKMGGAVQLSKTMGGVRFFKVGWHGWDYTGLRFDSDRNNPSRLGRLTQLAYTNPVTPGTRARGSFWSEGWGVLAEVWTAAVAGFVSTAQQFGQVYACTHPGEEALMWVTQLDGVTMDPGEIRDSEWGFLQFVPMPNPEPACEFVDAVARQMQARVPASPLPPMWTHWYHYYHNISEPLLLQNLDSLARVQQDIPIRVVELDDGYQSAWGDWTTTNQKFPHGLEWLAGEISARGFIPGLWLAPFAVQGKSQVAQQHPDWLVKDNKGRPAIVGFQYNMFIHALDLTHPEVLEHLQQLAYSITHQLGFGMLKLDFINAAALPGRRYNPRLTRAQALRLGLEAVRQAAGEHTFLLACGCPFGPAIGMVDAMRIGPDTAPNWAPSFHWMRWAGPFIKPEPSMPSLRNALRHTLNLGSLHRKWWWNDPDCLVVRDKDSHLTRHEVQSAVTLVGLSGGMLALSDNLNQLNASRQRWVSLLVPNLGFSGQSIDWFEHEMPHMYRLKLNEANLGWQVVALFNWEDQPADLSLWFEKLGYPRGGKLHVFDFWSRHYMLVCEPQLVFRRVPAHGCKLLRICEVKEAPQLVGDTLHISQGGEFKSMRIADSRLQIETIDMERRVEGELWLAVDEAPKEAHCDGTLVKVDAKGEGVYAIHIEFTGKAEVEVIF